MTLSTEGRLVHDMAARRFGEIPMQLFADVETGAWPTELWSSIEELGLPFALVGDEAGGFGLPLQDGLALIGLAGWAALPLPLAETMIGNWLLANAGLRVESGPLTLLDAEITIENGLTGIAEVRAPWARYCDAVAVAKIGHRTQIVRLRHDRRSAFGNNIAGEPLDQIAGPISVSESDIGACADGLSVRRAGAAMRTIQMAGAIKRVTEMTLTYVQERKQFGRPLSGFQVIQHQIAQLAGETAAAQMAAEIAMDAFSEGLESPAVAVGKIRAGEAAGKTAMLAHQLHGAMGFAREHSLHLYVRRLWAWRDGFGSEAVWSDILGRAVAPAGADLWRELTRI